ncbi:hypothetical protein ACI3RH_13765, partial [Lactococcus lactis]
SGIREAFWPARMEKLGEKPLILLDGAHNVHAMNRLLENLPNSKLLDNQKLSKSDANFSQFEAFLSFD